MMASINMLNKAIFDPKTRQYIYLREKLGSGAYGTVYRGWIPELSVKVAVKLAMAFDKSLETEKVVYELVGLHPQFPKYFGYTCGGQVSTLTIELLGCDLGKVTKTIIHDDLDSVTLSLMIISLIGKLEVLHENGYVHCDIKPSNILIGRNCKTDTLYLCDFGLSSKYDFRQADSYGRYKGTRKFASRATQKYRHLCPQDDLESLGYTIMFLCKEITLGWEKFMDEGTVIACKEVKTYKDLTEKHFPPLMEYMKIVTLPTRDKQPDYDRLTGIFERYLEGKETLCLSWLSAKFAKRLRRQKYLYSSEDGADTTKPSETKKKKKKLKKQDMKTDKKCLVS